MRLSDATLATGIVQRDATAPATLAATATE